jgi:hypothetical protein
MSRTLRAHWRPILISLFLFFLNAYICRELFSAEFLNNLSSNDGGFISVARFFEQHGTGGGWFPWFNTGMPIENAYQPLLPVIAAVTGRLSGWPIARAFHFVLAVFYCLGPVALFWFAWDWSESLFISFVAGIAYTLTSPAELLIPMLRIHSSHLWGGLRLFNQVIYAEDSHNAAVPLLLLAFLFLRRAFLRPNRLNFTAAVAFCASVVSMNPFGAIDLVVGGLCMALVLGRGLTILFPAGIAAWLLISPMLPPSMINLMRQDQWSAHGSFNSQTLALLSVFAVAAAFGLIWLLTRRLSSTLFRFSMLFGYWMCIITIGYFLLNLTLAPQAGRYQLEMEIALCLCFAFLCARIPWRVLVIALILVTGVWQTILLRRYSRRLLQPINITQTIEYKVVEWLDRNFPGERTMVSGDPEFLYNVLSNNPQMSAGHEPTAPNFEQRVAVYTIYSGENAGTRDAEYSILWLKAFGNQAIYVPGDKSRENYHPIAHPHKFDGVLPVLWHGEDDTIFAVPQRSHSLAHVIPASAVVARAPIHGLDVEPVRPYVAALDDPALPVAEITWHGPSRALVHAPMKRNQVLSVQVTWAPGWRASVNGRKIPLRKDGIDLMVLEPGCDSVCDVQLNYGPTPEAWICRILSALTALSMIGLLVVRFKGRRRDPIT